MARRQKKSAGSAVGFGVIVLLFFLFWLYSVIRDFYDKHPTLTISVIVVIVVLGLVILGWRVQRNKEEELRKQQEEAERKRRWEEDRKRQRWGQKRRREVQRRLEQQKQKAHSLRSGKPRRETIPKSVKIFVWQRDGGRCVQCGSNERLEYDHIIPVSKGGSNTERNLQLLCQRCNRSKGASIG